ncbi:hypothetical protein J2Y03_002447 [Neobacillus niacini]|uniref:hypothetical protein n=1 Tax=Neobacillus niacini TaxID=86668 RepID=UPI0028632E05|nr:hypothetical protein [Neobacillus niacini]MDR7077423.1 hypothetical protein [Neobacillus niacini]
MTDSLGREAHHNNEEADFTYHKKSGYIGFIWAMVFVMVVESVGVSFLLYKWSPILHWLHLILSISVILFLLVDLRAVTKNPILLKNNELYLKIGVRPSVMLNINDIKEIRNGNLHYNDDRKKKEILDLSLIGLDEPTFELVLYTPIENKLLIGKSSSINRIFFSVDEKEEFTNLIKKGMKER